MKRLKRLGLVVGLMLLANVSFAQNDALNETLVRLINQINAMMPLLDEAKDEQEPHARITLHIERFTDREGRVHAGVREDLLAIRNSLIEFINEPAIAPKTIKPLALDYIGRG
ncbi:hypothetical protein ACQUW5_14070 [Legionella sp. CNM-1927-20]|uniref:hypothetical protein n=1 Tax=Legionella sp. CNM-1927-20 TaxID=3422221 RepID=UPI00403AAEAF